MTVLEVLKERGGISRAELAARTGQSDRAVRKEIERLRMAGHIIGNRQDGSGYFLSVTTTKRRCARSTGRCGGVH